MHRVWIASLAAVGSLLATSQSALAYVGPGAGLAAIGTVAALLGAVALVVIGFVWYPVKRLRAKLRNAEGGDAKGEAEHGGTPTP